MGALCSKDQDNLSRLNAKTGPKSRALSAAAAETRTDQQDLLGLKAKIRQLQQELRRAKEDYRAHAEDLEDDLWDSCATDAQLGCSFVTGASDGEDWDLDSPYLEGTSMEGGDLEELVLASLSLPGEEPRRKKAVVSKKAVRIAFNELDQKNIGKVDVDDFVSACQSLDLGLEDIEARRLFDSVTAEPYRAHDGALSFEAFRRAVRRCGFMKAIVSNYANQVRVCVCVCKLTFILVSP